MTAIGIDLGTTYSAIARLDEHGRPATIVNEEGDLVTPSVVLIEEGCAIVGKEAVKALASEPQRIAECAKRDMGRRTYRKLLEGQAYPPEALQACVLRKLVCDARQQVGEITHAVITVPAYFDDVRRKATQDAGHLAGLEVLDIINEPTAAALCHGLQQGSLSPQGTAPRAQKLVVYDLGGGTFDVTIMEIAGSEFRTLATDGDVELGGRDWDQRLVDHIAAEFQRQHGVDPRQDGTVAGRLWRECEEAKRTLTARPKAVMACEYQGRSLRVDLLRGKFVELTADLLDRTRFTTRQVLQQAGLDWGVIDQLLLVGGSSRMPMVREMLRDLSGKEPQLAGSPDEAVAHGAALHAGLLLARSSGRPPRFAIRNVNSHSLGVVGTDLKTGRKRVGVVVPRNTPLPVTAQRLFRTQQAGQPSILVPIVEGESPTPDACTAIGECLIDKLPPQLPAQTPILVRFHYAENGRLTIGVKVGESGQEIMQSIDRVNGLSAEQLAAWRQWVFKAVAG